MHVKKTKDEIVCYKRTRWNCGLCSLQSKCYIDRSIIWKKVNNLNSLQTDMRRKDARWFYREEVSFCKGLRVITTHIVSLSYSLDGRWNVCKKFETVNIWGDGIDVLLEHNDWYVSLNSFFRGVLSNLQTVSMLTSSNRGKTVNGSDLYIFTGDQVLFESA